MRSLTALAASVALAAGMVYYTAAPSVAFAQVAKQLADAKSLSFRTTMEMKSKNGESQTITFRTFFLDPGRYRMEGLGDLVVGDAKAQIFLTLNPDAKTAVRIKGSDGGGQVQQAAMQVNALKELVDKPNTPLGEKKIGGVKAVGFQVKEGDQKVTVWVDAATKLPVLVEQTMPLIDGIETVWVMDEFVVDARLDEKLFSLDVPKGYTLTEEKLPEFGRTPEEVVAEVLKAYAEAFDGRFPPELLDETAVDLLTEKQAKKMKLNPNDPVESGKRAGLMIGSLLRTLDNITKEEHGYAADGVKLGDEKVIVFWRKEKGKETYKAVRGDLKIVEVTKDQLPKK